MSELAKNLQWSNVKPSVLHNDLFKMLLLRSIIVKEDNQTDITICMVIADVHIPQAGGKNFLKYNAPSSVVL